MRYVYSGSYYTSSVQLIYISKFYYKQAAQQIRNLLCSLLAIKRIYVVQYVRT